MTTVGLSILYRPLAAMMHKSTRTLEDEEEGCGHLLQMHLHTIHTNGHLLIQLIAILSI